MKKTISVLSMISIAIAAFSLLLAVSLLTFFWEPICLLFSGPTEAVEAGPIIPIGNMLSMLGCLIVAIVVYVCSKSNTAIAGEIVSVVLLSVVLPVLAGYLSMVQSAKIGHTMGTNAVIALSIATQITSFVHRLMDVSSALCLVVCGMSISRKSRLKEDKSAAGQPME